MPIQTQKLEENKNFKKASFENPMVEMITTKYA